ncbi:MAG: discoidin domain-containing protein [Calditrichaeota bacterium]|nr:discoidin domain-containing protein [Calditrichota bacterium]
MRKLGIVVAASLTMLVLQGRAQERLLDDFEQLQGWQPVTSEGAQLKLLADQGRAGQAMLMDFSFGGGFGYVIARRQFEIELPEDYQFLFDLRGATPINNFEFKLIDSLGNVYWVKKLNVEFPAAWKTMRVKRRDISFAWGPSGPGQLKRAKYVEFVVSTGSGGSGKVWIDNFRFEVLHAPAAPATPKVRVSAAQGAPPRLNASADTLTGWSVSAAKATQWLAIDFGRLREIGGLVLDWEPGAHAKDYAVDVSSDGRAWEELYRVRGGNGGRDYVPTPGAEGRHLRLRLLVFSDKVCRLKRMVVKGPEFSSSPNDLFRALAKETPTGSFPAFFSDRQTYWTVVGVNGDSEEALINEHGMIEVGTRSFSLEPFLWIGGRLVCWHDVAASQTLAEGYLPIPTVTWQVGEMARLSITAVATGDPGNSILFVRYRVVNEAAQPAVGALFVAVRPFQVTPPWQTLNTTGGVGRIDTMSYSSQAAVVDGRTILSLTPPADFGATTFDRGDIADYLQRGALPEHKAVSDPRHLASAAFRYDVHLAPGDSADYVLAVPLHDASLSAASMLRGCSPGTLFQDHLARAGEAWVRELNRVKIKVPPAAAPLVNTLRSNIAYILINRDGPSIKPGSRTYDRSWIRDGSLTSTALLQMGFRDEPRAFIDWYANYQYPSGKVPCVVDERGPDPLPEHDSHGEFIFAVMQYFRFSGDTTWLRGKWPQVVKAARYIQSLRRERKGEEYRLGPPEKRVLYGLLPESISHEGYSAKPMHSYWDDFFALRGLKDATLMAELLGEKEIAAEFGHERDDLRTDLYHSVRLAMNLAGIDYIPGCAELGDFDPTSTTIGVCPGGELGRIPEPELHNTFERYFRFAQERQTGTRDWENYTPYELRAIGTFVQLDQRERAHELLAFFMNDRRPPGWNQWAEVVWKDPVAPKFIGDMPHTWVGSDFIRSVRAVFAYEDDGGNLVLAAGIPAAWLEAPGGVEVEDLPTYFGLLSYTARREGKVLRLSIELRQGGQAKVLVKPAYKDPIRRIRVNGKPHKELGPAGIRVTKLPALVEIEY